MLSGIDWATYFIGLFVLLVFYYGILYLLYTKKDHQGSHQQMIKASPLAFAPPNDSDLLDAIEGLIVEAKENQSANHELFFALQQLLKNRSDMDASIKIKIQNAIQSNMQRLGMHGFDADELVRLWKH